MTILLLSLRAHGFPPKAGPSAAAVLLPLVRLPPTLRRCPGLLLRPIRGEVGILTTSFVPPYPPRPAEPLRPLAALRMARRNFLAGVRREMFEYQFFSADPHRQLFVCNSPETVAQTFIALHDSFERKTPQMRHALTPLLGDGLFVSDGETWKQRRRIVAPIVHASRLSLFAPIMVEAAAETAERWAKLPPSAPIDALREMATRDRGDHLPCRIRPAPWQRTRQYDRRLIQRIPAGWSDNSILPISLGLPDWVPRFHAPSIRRAARQIHRVLDDIIRQCKEAQGEAR